MINYIRHDPGIIIDPSDIAVIETLAQLEINTAQQHNDPSDHIIISQALAHKMALVSSDTKFAFYRKQGLQLIENF